MAELILKDNNYYIVYNGKENYLCKNNEINNTFLDDIVNTFLKNIEIEERLEEWKKNLGYILMRKNEAITYLEFTSEGEMIDFSKKIINKELTPLQDMYQNNWLKLWWKERSIPIEQDNIKNFLRDKGFSMPSEFLIKNLDLSLTDYYWIKPIDSDLTWESVNLYDNDFKDNLLIQDNDVEKNTLCYSPNGSLQGTIEKSWIIKNNERHLLKGNHSNLSTESINEVIACEIHKRQNYNNYVNYDLVHIKGKDYNYGCISKLFTSQNKELISAWALYTNEKKNNSVSNYEHLLNMCEKFGMDIELVKKDLEYQIMTDFVISCHDRHLNNIAFLRDADSLQFIGMAPIFDSGGSMFVGRAIPYKNEKDLYELKTNSFVSEEIKLLNLIENRNIIDLTKLPPSLFY